MTPTANSDTIGKRREQAIWQAQVNACADAFMSFTDLFAGEQYDQLNARERLIVRRLIATGYLHNSHGQLWPTP